MNLIIDAGNTLVKYAVFDKEDLVFRQQTSMEEVLLTAKKICDDHPRIEWCIVSSVNTLDEKILLLLSVFCEVIHLNATTPTPFKNSYASPHTLGVDRIALATAAFYHNPNGNTLVIDAGTCVTYDMVNDYGEYLGGAISMGLRMRYRALHEQTARLPLLEPGELFDFIGNTSETSIQSGVLNGLQHEIDGFINQYKSRFVDLTVILTGGDAQFLSKRLKNTIFADSNFLLKGLNYLLEYNKH
ncbi:type III pantothenate kinase [Aggregatimonas sangjinii]|uniref:Type III pantothenate kinase n=1 Tax=Aggregatimonas sangjinii TaxID=2583587 RepID=A0A5B7SNW2_9FLAO|nr:type III pantothenate kinase [Aggregatimonas sangjinii]QCW98710.1 type III pantothenate kinase [Aggregatimonas sangjinii]